MHRYLFPALFAFVVSLSFAPSSRASDVGGGAPFDLRLVPPALIQDIVDAPADDDEPVRLAQGNGKKKGKGQGGGSRVRVGASMVGASGVSPMGKTFGVGLELGAPVSVTIKYMLTGDQGVVAGLGAFGGSFFVPTISLYGDYLWHPHIIVRAPPFKLSWYIGGGLWVVAAEQNLRYAVPGFDWYVYGSSIGLAARLPLGINFALNELPLEFYLQGVPALFVFPSVALGIGGSLGFRFYF